MKFKVNLIGGGTAEVELRDREAVRRLFQNHGFWYQGTFYSASAIYSIEPIQENAGELAKALSFDPRDPRFES